MSSPPLRILVLALALALGCRGDGPAAGEAGAGAGTAAAAELGPANVLGEGFVVWESNRSGDWRIWIRDLDGLPPRQLSPDEAGRQHCCAHVAPDGRRVAYLSLPRGQERYPESGASGPLHLIATAGRGAERQDRVLVEEARTYFEHRAAVWRSDRELIYIDGEGRTRLLDLETGASRVLVAEPRPAHGWLVNRTLTHATAGQPVFAPLDVAGRRVEPTRIVGGCQPYFSFDGRWGIWISGAGGPVRRIDLATREMGTILAKNDPRLSDGLGYIYFPMLSHDSRLLAFAASAGEHDHFRADYEVFVAPLDPATLELAGAPVRITAHRATDRYPDVYSRPLPLGRHAGEAPFTVELAVPEAATPGGDWRWSLGDGQSATGASVRHTYARPGSYRLRAERGGKRLEGAVEVRPAAPPRVVAVDLRRGREIVVTFDEPIDVTGLEASLASGRKIAASRTGEGGRSLLLELAAELQGGDELRLAGVADRAQKPNRLAPARLAIPPPGWPSERDGLAFLWQSDGHPNQVEDPSGGVRTSVVEPRGAAWYDRHGAMAFRGGTFMPDAESMQAVLRGATAANELTLELTLTPKEARTPEPTPIFSFSGGPGRRNFVLFQVGDRLVFELATVKVRRGEERPRIDLGPIAAGRPQHVIVTYTPGQLVAWVDGRRRVETDVVRSGFFHWGPRTFLLGGEWNVPRTWRGEIEGVAVYARFLSEAEALENHHRTRRRLDARPELPELRLRGRLVGRSRIPTLTEIAPYRDALAVFEYEVERVVAGRYAKPRVRVVERVWAAGERTPVSERAPGTVVDLDLEPFFDQPQLESLYLSNTLPASDLTLYYEDEIEP